MASGRSAILLGTNWTRQRRLALPGVAVALLAATFAAYGLGVFDVAGGIVWIPFHAAVVGTLAAVAAGYARAGLLAAWSLTYASLLGYHADHAFLGLTGRVLAERAAYFVRPDGLTVLAVEGVVLGTLAFSVGAALRRVAAD